MLNKALHLNVEHNKLVLIGAGQCVHLIQCLELPTGVPHLFFQAIMTSRITEWNVIEPRHWGKRPPVE